jgi:hypothetical protein
VKPRILARCAYSILSVVIGAGFLVAMPLSAPSQAATAPGGEYVAMGDSYSSGEGLEATAPKFISPTNTDGCDRSTKSYPELVARSLDLNLSTFNTYPKNAFVACSGARTSDITSTFRGEPSQINALKEYGGTTKYVSLTAGGDNLGFAGVIKDCTDLTIKEGRVTYTQSSFLSHESTCTSEIEAAKGQVFSGTSAPSSLQNKLQTLYTTIMSKAPNAELLVLNYPQIFTKTPPTSFCPIAPGEPIPGSLATLYMSLSPLHVDQFDLVQVGLDDSIANAVASLQAQGSKIQLVDINSGTQAQAFACNTNTNSQSDINGVHFAPGSSLTSLIHNCSFRLPDHLSCNGDWASVFARNFLAKESFHPTADAHQYMATQVEGAIAPPCTTAALSSPLPASTAGGTPSVVSKFACNSQWAVAYGVTEGEPPENFLAILEWENGAWRVQYLGDGTCAAQPTSASECPSGSNPTLTIPQSTLSALAKSAGLFIYSDGSVAPPPTGPYGPGYNAAEQQWLSSPNVGGSADENVPLLQAVTDLTNGLKTDLNTGGYQAAIGYLQNLIQLPDAMVTPQESAEATTDDAALDKFFGTPGLYGPGT